MKKPLSVSVMAPIVFVGLLLGAITQAKAGTTSTSFTSSATVNALCKTLTASDLAFGTYDPTSVSDTTATTTVGVTCTNGTVASIEFSAGTTSGATAAQRKMASSGHTLNYNLYTSNGYTQVLDATHKLQATGNGLGTSVSVTAYGMIPKGQLDTFTGAFSDSITVTVTY